LEKASPFPIKGFHPAAAHSLFARGEQLARLRGEKSFPPRTCHGRKLISRYFAAAAAKLYEVF